LFTSPGSAKSVTAIIRHSAFLLGCGHSGGDPIANAEAAEAMQDAAARVLAIAALLLNAVIPIEFCGYALRSYGML
jgi:hypothetical protein